MTKSLPPSVPVAPRISIIIPAFDEAHSLGKTIAAARRHSAPVEIVVVDAGSSDGSAEIAAEAGARVLRTRRRQRASQLNLGAQQARGSLLIFLHADTLLPPNALHAVVIAFRDRRVVGGAFTRRYDSRSLVLAFTCWLGSLRNRTMGWHLGDQAMFVRGKVFDQMGGFREVDQFEDLDFSRRLRRIGKTVTLQPAVVSSPRRFQRKGALRTTLRDFCLTLRYLVVGLETAKSAPDRALGASRETTPRR